MATSELQEGPFPDTVPLPARIREKKEKRKKLRLGQDRVADALFRTSYRTHTDLSAQADRKASILISINGLIITISLASMGTTLDANPWLLLPGGVLLLGCVISMSYAVLTARPRVTRNVITLEQVRESRANILFFGNFISLTEAQYEEGIGELMREQERVYQTMTRDLYALGKVLDRKFQMLWIAYTVQMVSLASSVVLYLAVHLAEILR